MVCGELQMNISVFGTDYARLSNAVFMIQNHDVITLDIDLYKMDKLNNKKNLQW